MEQEFHWEETFVSTHMELKFHTKETKLKLNGARQTSLSLAKKDTIHSRTMPHFVRVARLRAVRRQFTRYILPYK
ncbi:hypothetical protein, partial [uncultured Bacteroides sp.]|uniref:hypothetical protein n=1 Tax=uncultured Bacteroides sp. TaxID=162156 RepID=UPI00266FA53B